MVKRIAVSSDNHLDVNRIDPEIALTMQSEWLIKQGVNYYFYAGDLFNDFQKTRLYFQRLQERLKDHVAVYYIAGNHEMLNNASYSSLEGLGDHGYLHNQHIDILGTDWRIIANNGWYDYSFSRFITEPAAVQRWKNVYWLDSSVDQPMSDVQRMQIVLHQVTTQLHAAQAAHKTVLFLTHFAPWHELLGPRPARISNPRQERFYQMIRAMMGSEALGDLLAAFSNVKVICYGHLHGQHHAQRRGQATYLHQAVGVKNKRLNEWEVPTFSDQWKRTLRIIDLDRGNWSS